MNKKSFKLRKVIKILFTLFFSFFVIFLLSEITLRFLPVTKGIQGQTVTVDQPVFRFEPNSEYMYSVGPLLLGANSGKINNYGFVNDADYESQSSSPLLAIVGDSYIEAFMVPYANTLQGRLSQLTSNRVYSFGTSGAPLSQYLKFSRFADEEFKPDCLIINVVGNDFDESLPEYKNSPGYHYFHSDVNGTLVNRLVSHQKQTHLLGIIPRNSFLASVLKESHLMQYLYKNAKVLGLVRRVREKLTDEQNKNRYVGNTKSSYDDDRLRRSKLAVDAFFRDLPIDSGLSSDNVLFTVDGLRQSIYNPQIRIEAKASYFGVMREYFMNKAIDLGYEVLDLDPVFVGDYKSNKVRFEEDYDGHWNSYAHGIVSEEVTNTKLWQIFSGQE
jgi:hypothetical protein